MSEGKSFQHRADGILRKCNEEDDFLLFGYSCKLFRDDEKALFIDQGKHLIPWMGDDTLKIDRYDVRGALSDIKPYEPPSGGYDRWYGVTETDKQIEQLCDEERYRSLYHNEEEEALYHEEELKRFQNALGGATYGQVGFTYDDSEAVKTDDNKDVDPESEADKEDDQPFVAPPGLDIPLNMVVPKTVKENTIIEKTAMFISQQGPQMEIVLKMKQAGNKQFDFLSFDSSLHAYYRHLVMVMKSGRYRILTQPSESDVVDSSDDHYLHPVLASGTTSVDLAPSIPSINYKPSADCAYSMLVNKIKGKQSSLLSSSYFSASNVDNEETAVNFITDESSKDASYSNSPGPSAIWEETSNDGHLSKRSISPSTDSSDSYSSSSSKKIEIPPLKVQCIIEKMASYVVKNGRDFEDVVKSRGDSRFDFLEKNHMYHPFYEERICELSRSEKGTTSATSVHNAHLSNINKEKSSISHAYLSGNSRMNEGSIGISNKSSRESHSVSKVQNFLPVGKSSDKPDSDKSGSDNKEYDDQSRRRRKSDSEKEGKGEVLSDLLTRVMESSTRKQREEKRPVSFSIKNPRESDGLIEPQSALPIDESSDETDENNSDSQKKQPDDQSKRKKKSESEKHSKPEVLSDLLTKVMETNAKKQKEERRESSRAKWASQHAKDKLLVMARERLAAAEKEKLLQQKRKKKLAEFLNHLQQSQMSGSPQLCSGYSSHGAQGSADQDSPESDIDATVLSEIEKRFNSKSSSSSNVTSGRAQQIHHKDKSGSSHKSHHREHHRLSRDREHHRHRSHEDYRRDKSSLKHKRSYSSHSPSSHDRHKHTKHSHKRRRKDL